MSFEASVLLVMIASPSDVRDETQIALEVIQRWNDVHAATRQMVLLPISWRTHSTPEYGKSPQEIINRQVLREADVLIGIFWTRLGTRTATHDSGTAEEIDRHHAAGKVTKLYFSDTPISPVAIDAEQYAKLRDFRRVSEKNGLVASYSSKEEFREMLSRHLDLQFNAEGYLDRLIRRERAENTIKELNGEELDLIETAYIDRMVILAPDFTGRTKKMGIGGDMAYDDDVAVWRQVARGLVTKGIFQSARDGFYALSFFGYALGPLALALDNRKRVYRYIRRPEGEAY